MCPADGRASLVSWQGEHGAATPAGVAARAPTHMFVMFLMLACDALMMQGGHASVCLCHCKYVALDAERPEWLGKEVARQQLPRGSLPARLPTCS